MSALDIIIRTISVPTIKGTTGGWQYHSRSDHHSRVSCWAIMFDLLQESATLRRHAAAKQVTFGVNHPLTSHVTGRPKALDLVICRPGGSTTGRTFADLANLWNIQLTPSERATLAGLPALDESPVGAVLTALEAKACMTKHSSAAPRLYDELNSSHQTIHSATSEALAIALVMINVAPTFISSDRNKFDDPALRINISRHTQPAAAAKSVATIRDLPRRANARGEGYDGVGVVVVDARNDGTPWTLHTALPAPPPGDVLNYTTMLNRMAHEYDARFAGI